MGGIVDYKYESVKFQAGIPAKIWNQDMIGHEMYTPQHWHRSVEIDLVTEGRMMGMVNGKSRILYPGDFLFANSGDIHVTNYVERTDHLRAVTILISYDFMVQCFPGYADYFFAVEESCGIWGELIRICTEIGQANASKSQWFDLKINGRLYELVYLLLNETLEVKNNAAYLKQQKHVWNAKKAVDYINVNYKEELSLGLLADYMGFNPAYFSRFFKNQTGTTFYHYLNEVRLHYALLDLIHKDATSTECAMSHGFPNIKSFIEQFKKVYGCTPSQYKKEYAKSR